MTMVGGKRVLLVEDDDAIRQLVRDLLSDAGYDVSEARSGNEGLQIAREVRPDLVILDRLMPDGDGTAFALGYRRMPGPHAPIIALCAAREGPEWSRAIDAAAHIGKPFDIDRLLATVDEVLAGRDLRTGS